MSQVKYQVILKNPITGDIFELLPLSYSFSEKLNNEPTASFKFSYEQLEQTANVYGTTVLAMFSTSRREIYINRNTTKIYYGVVTEMSISPGSNGEKNVDIKSCGFFGMFRNRIVGIPKTVYTSTDAGDIAWDLIDDSQSSDGAYSTWSITQGATPATVTRDRTYRFDNVAESIVRLSNENLDDGFDFDIDTNKAFNVYYPTKGTSRPNVIFDEITLSGFSWKKELLRKLSNKVYVLGQGFNDDVLYSTRTASTTYRDPWRTQETVLNEREITQSTTLESKGDRYLLDWQDPIIYFNAEHFDNDDLIGFDDYNLGDTVVINMPTLGLSSSSKRIIQIDFSVDESSFGKIKLVLK